MNIQTLPRRDVVVKRAFKPKLDCMLFADYNQIELRIMAYYMAMLGEDSMRNVLVEGRDIYAETALGIFQLDREPTKAERHLGKSVTLSMGYGGGTPAVKKYLAEFNVAGGSAPVTWAYAKKVIANFHATWPGVKRVENALWDTFESRGYLLTIAGAHLHPRSKHTTLNLVAQSSAAEVMRRAMRTCHKKLEGFDSHLVCVVHDELVFDVRDDELAYLIDYVPIWMDCFPEVSEVVPITVAMEYSDTYWSEKKELDV